MKQLTLLEKNAYLKLFFAADGIYAHLVYTDYEGESSYVLDEFTSYPSGFYGVSGGEVAGFFKSYLLTLQRVFDWELFEKGKSIPVKFPLLIKGFSGEGVGCRGISVSIGTDFLEALGHQELNSFSKIIRGAVNLKLSDVVSSVRSVCSEIMVDIQTTEIGHMIMEGLAKKWGYEKLLVVDMNTCVPSVVEIVQSEYVENVVSSQSRVLKCGQGFEASIIDELNCSGLEPYLLQSVSEVDLSDVWANYIGTGLVVTSDCVCRDLIRATLIKKFLSISNSKSGVVLLKNWQSDALRSNNRVAIVVIGEAVRILEKKELFLVLVDGLQLGGTFDLIYDKERCLGTLGVSYLNDTNASDVIVHRKMLNIDMDHVVIPKMDKRKKKRRVVIAGDISTTDDVVSFHAITPQVQTVKIPSKNGGNLRLQLEKKVLLGGSGGVVEYQLVDGVGSVILDCRYKPIQYGPDSKANRLNMKEWLNE